MVQRGPAGREIKMPPATHSRGLARTIIVYKLLGRSDRQGRSAKPKEAVMTHAGKKTDAVFEGGGAKGIGLWERWR